MALTDNIVSYWKFDESSGNAADSVGSNTLTNNGTATFVSAKINNGTDVNGTSQYFSIADASQTGLDFSGDFTLSGWVMFDAYVSTTLYTFVSKLNFGDGGTSRSYALVKNLTGTNKLDLAISDGTNYNAIGVSWTPSTATWYYVSVVHTSGASAKAQFYVNGAQQGTDQSSTATGTILNSSRPFHIGMTIDGVTNSYFFNGKFDEWGAWSRALSSSEISQLYNSGTGLAYPFSGGGGATNTGATQLMMGV